VELHVVVWAQYIDVLVPVERCAALSRYEVLEKRLKGDSHLIVAEMLAQLLFEQVGHRLILLRNSRLVRSGHADSWITLAASEDPIEMVKNPTMLIE